jgi:circadian clock protein KaiB
MSATSRPRLTLYIAGATPRAVRAITNLDRILERLLPVRYEVDIVDVLEQPEQAQQAGIMATPALVREVPLPRCIVIGPLDDTEQALRLLRMAAA